jgi:hypothetical protein
MVDQKTIGSIYQFVKMLSIYIHNQIVEHKINIDKNIRDVYGSIEKIGAGPIKSGTINNIYVFRKRYKNKPDKDGKINEVLRFVPDTYIIELPLPENLDEILNIPLNEFMYYKRQLYKNTIINKLNIQINENNLKYTIDEIIFVISPKKILVTIEILDN